MLQGKRIFVAGGTGDVGSDVVAELLAAGCEVIVPARDVAKSERLKRQLGNLERLTLLLGDIGISEGADALAATVQSLGAIDGVVASLGGWWQGPLLTEVTPAEWDRLIAGNLTTHFNVARSFLPLLSSGATYVQLLGAAAEYPVPSSSLVSITAAAVAMMGRVLAAENEAGDVHVRQIMIASIVATRARPSVDPAWVTARQVGAAVVEILANPKDNPTVVRLSERR